MSFSYDFETATCAVDFTTPMPLDGPDETQCTACGVFLAPTPSVLLCCAAAHAAYCSPACRLVDAPRHDAAFGADLAALAHAAAAAPLPPVRSLAAWMEAQQAVSEKEAEEEEEDEGQILLSESGKRRRVDLKDEVAADSHSSALGNNAWFSAFVVPSELELAAIMQPPPAISEAAEIAFQLEFLAPEPPPPMPCAVSFGGSEDQIEYVEYVEPLVVATPAAPAPAAARRRAARGETALKKIKRSEYAQLTDAERAKLRALGVADIDAFAAEFERVVGEVTYLHTRRQRIVVWLADSPLFPLMSWDHAELDEFGQSRLILNAKRESVHTALTILLKSDITEWLFKRVRRATTSEGAWLFKEGQYALLLQHAAKAVEAKR